MSTDNKESLANLEKLANGWDASELAAFYVVMGDATMPDYKHPNYDDWLFHKAWKARQPEIDALRAENHLLSKHMDSALRTGDAMREKNVALHAEVEKMRKLLGDAKENHYNTSMIPDEMKETK